MRVDGELVGAIGPGSGLLVLLGVREGDGEAEAAWLAKKIAGLRIFADDSGRFDRSLVDVGGEVLVVSQFTLYGETRRGRRPDFGAAAAPKAAETLYESFVEKLAAELGRSVAKGVFGAMMDVSLVNQGPVTLMLERERSE